MMMQQDRASKKQQELLQFVDEFIKNHGYGPSYREIMRGLGYKSVSTVAVHIDNLIAKGYLIRRDKSARSLDIVSRSQSSAVIGTTDNDMESKLEAYIRSRQLDKAQRQQVITTLETLGLTQLAQKLENTEES